MATKKLTDAQRRVYEDLPDGWFRYHDLTGVHQQRAMCERLYGHGLLRRRWRDDITPTLQQAAAGLAEYEYHKQPSGSERPTPRPE